LCLPLNDEQIQDLAARGGRELRRELDAEKDKAKQDGDGTRGRGRGRAAVDGLAVDRDRSGHLDGRGRSSHGELRHPDRMLFRQFLTPGVEWNPSDHAAPHPVPLRPLRLLMVGLGRSVKPRAASRGSVEDRATGRSPWLTAANSTLAGFISDR
jgi:hypothetical protein